MSTVVADPPTAPPPGPPDAGDPAAALRQLAAAVDAMVAAVPSWVPVAELGDLLVGLQGRLDALGGVAAEWTKTFADAGGCEEAGAPSLAAWFRQHLRSTPVEARRRVRAAEAMDRLPGTRQALAAGELGTSQLDAIAVGLRQLGPAVMVAAEPVVLGVAKVCDADAVKATIKRLRDTLDPDAAEAAYLIALERRDITVAAVGEGYAVHGFLDPQTGAAFREVLYAAAKPTDADDGRTAGQRRVDALRDLCTSVLAQGLPTDRGLRPQLFVTVPADRLTAATSGEGPGRGSTDRAAPAMLAGYGPIPDTLLGKLACDAVTTTVTVASASPGAAVLDVGRSSRLATLKQRQAIFVSQGGTCANPGCANTHLEIHHRTPWRHGGATDLANLAGYCTRCHHLIHQGQLELRPDGCGGWTHLNRRGRPLHDHHRHRQRRSYAWTHALLHGGLAHADKALGIRT
jgi:hypothetical protein